MIELHNISKTFRVARRNSGFGEAVKALFKREYTEIHALSDVSFRIGDGTRIRVRRAKEQILLVVAHNISFYETLHCKMMWDVDIRN